VAGNNDFVLKLGFKIDAKSISKTALRAALNSAASGVVLRISKVKLESPAKIRKDISTQIGTIQIKNISVSAQASKAFSKSINDKVRPVIKGLTVSPASLANLRKSVERALRNVAVRTSSAGGGGAARSPGGGRAAQSTARQASAEQNLSSAINQRRNALLNANRVEQQAIRSMTAQQRASIRLTQALRQSGISFNEVGARVAQVTKRFTEYTLSVKGLQAAQAIVRTAIKGVKELDKATRDLAKVGSVGPDIAKSFNAISTTALVTGKTVGEASTAIGEFVRQGKDLATAAKFAEKALQLTNISNLDAASSARLVTAAQQVFGITTADLGAKLSSLAVFADSSATSVTEVGTAFLRTASSASSAGLTIEQTFAILASTLEQTRLNASTVGTAFKTIFARLGRDRGKVADLAASFGLVIDSALPIADFLPKLAAGFRDLNSDQKNLVALQVAGVRQANVFIAALENWDKSQELLNNTQEDASALTRKNAEELKKLSVRANQVSVAVQTAAGALAGLEGGDQGGVAGIFGTTLDGLRDTVLIFPQLISGLNNATDSGIKLGNILSSALVGALVGAVGSVVPAMINGFKQMGVVAGQAATATTGINSALRQGVTLAEQKLAVNRQNLGVVNQTTQAHRRETGSSLRRSTSSRAASPVRNRGVDPSGRAVAGGAAFGVALFAAADAVTQLTDKLADTEGLDSATKAQIDFAGSAASQALVLAAIAGKSGALVGVISAAVTSITKSVTAYQDAVSNALQGGLTDNLTGLFANASLDLRDAGVESAKLVRDINKVIQEQLKANNVGDSFRSAIVEATSSITSGLEAAILELDGLPPSLAKLIADIESIKAQGDIITTTERIRDGEGGSGIETRSGSAAINKLISGEADSFQVANPEIAKAIEFAKNAQTAIDEASSEALTAESRIRGVTAAFGKLIDAFKEDPSDKGGLIGLNARFLSLEEGATDSSKAAIEAFRGINSALQSANGVGRLTGPLGRLLGNRPIELRLDDPAGLIEALEGARANLEGGGDAALKSLEAARADAGEIQGKAQARVNSLQEEAVDRAKELVSLQTSYNTHLETSIKLSQNLLDTISKESLEVKSKIDSELKISELKKGTLTQQIQAVVLAKKLTLESDANLKKIDQQIAANKKLGGSAEQLKGLQDIRDQAVSSLDQRALQQSQPEIKKLLDDDAAKRAEEAREAAITKVNAANTKVEASDLKRAEASKRLADANKKIISAERDVSSARKGVTSALLNIAAAQRNLSDTVTRSFATIRSSVRSAVSSAGFEKIGNIATSLGAVLTLEQRLSVIRREGLEESLRIAQKQAGTLLTIGERIATGGPGARQDAIRGLSTGQAIQSGASISNFTPEDIKLALQTADLFPGLKELIQTQGLASVGLDDELAQTRQSIVASSSVLAEQSAQTQIGLAESQLSAQLEGLVNAKATERIAQADLDLARVAVGQASVGLNTANVQVSLAQQNLAEAGRQTSGILSLKSALINATNSASSRTTNAARGTLSAPELRGLESAALREKSQMPAGSKLMLANTSETVLTRRQSKLMGISPRRQSNAAGGNGDVSGLSVLLSQVVSRLDQLNSSIRTGGVNNVNLQVDTNKNVNIKGIAGLGSKLESELRNKFASGNDVAAVESAIMNIISKLGEAGLADDLGR
jgi:TP901 family phage tail tape measure protein